MSIIISKKDLEKQVLMDGLMSLGILKNGLHVADFDFFDVVEMDPWIAKCKVQTMRDGTMYITELPKRIRNKPSLKLPHSSVSYGGDGYDRFTFTLPSAQRDEFARLLCDEAMAAGLFVANHYIKKCQNDG